MSKSVAYCTLIVAAALAVVLAAYAPAILSDRNAFLEKFVASDILNVLGVILAITLASAGQVHLAINTIEEKFGHRGLNKTRNGVHKAAYWLIGLFLIAILIVVVKPLLAKEDWSQSLFNGAALFILLWNVLILLSLTQMIFVMRPEIKG
jgi:hypothetical protein